MIFYFHCFGKPDVRKTWTEVFTGSTGRSSKAMTSSATFSSSVAAANSGEGRSERGKGEKGRSGGGDGEREEG